MADHPEQHDDMAMRHVLGGLDAEEAATFRQHLLGCGECRRRVVELRGIAADLQQVDRRERASLAALRTEAPPSTDPQIIEEPDPPRVSLSERLLGIALVVGVLVVVALAFWNFHLRSREAQLFGTIDNQREALELLVTGRPVPTTLPTTARGTVVVDEGRFAIDVSGIVAADDDVLVTWFYDGRDELLPGRTASLRPPEDGLFAITGDVGDAARVVVSLERLARDDRSGPGERVVLEAQLAGAPSGDADEG